MAMNQIRVVRSEPRLVRPFLGIDNVTSILENASIQINGTEYTAGTAVLPSPLNYENDFKIQLAFTDSDLEKALDAAKIPSEDVSLAVIAHGNTLKISQALSRFPLRHGFESEIVIERAALFDKIINDKEGFDLTVALVLHASHNRNPLRPTQVGTWLSRSRFRVRPERIQSSFYPEPLTENIRTDMNLPKKAMYYIHIIKDEILAIADLGEVTRCYVDESLLKNMQTNSKLPGSLLIQTTLASEIIFSLIQSIASELSDEDRVITDSNLGRISSESGATRLLTSLRQKWELEPEVILNMALEDPERLKAHITSNLNLLSQAESSLILEEVQ